MANRYPLAGLDIFKDYINETATTNDTFNQNLINRASRQIESYTKRNIRARTYTEFQDGDGSSGELFLKQSPIVSTVSSIEVYDDIDRTFASTSKFASTDFVIYADQGVVQLLTDSSLGSLFQRGIQNIKAVYIAGYDEFEIITGINDAIDFNEGGAEINSTLSSGTYTASTLATEIDTQLTTDGALSYTISYNTVNCKFTLTAASGTFQLLWSSGANAATSVGDTIGFLITADDTGALAYTADFSRPGIPQDIEMACLM
ncbi:hypothetical protein LCGC14_2265250, partial [marine sediment metagenome]